MAQHSGSRLEFLSINSVPQCGKRLLSSNELGRSEAEPALAHTGNDPGVQQQVLPSTLRNWRV